LKPRIKVFNLFIILKIIDGIYNYLIWRSVTNTSTKVKIKLKSSTQLVPCVNRSTADCFNG
jgi:hypothetical protein